MIFIVLAWGIAIRYIFKIINLPPLLGFLVLGIIVGPYGLDKMGLMHNYSIEIRLIALIIILLRAGFGIRKDVLMNYRMLSIMMGSVPAILEGLCITLASMVILDFNVAQGGMLGFVLAAVSPAVIVPAMLKLNDLGYHKVPTVILAGASLDDVFAITIFSTFSSLYFTKVYSAINLLRIPLSIILGLIIGLGLGLVLKHIVSCVNSLVALIILVMISFVFIRTTESIGFDIAVYLSVMSMAMVINNSEMESLGALKVNLDRAWKYFEILLFVLVGALVDPKLALSAGLGGLVIVGIGLVGRYIGVLWALHASDFKRQEKLFSLLAYTPKATVQAAMGGIPLSLGVVGGDIILAIAVLSIFITAPLGAILIDKSYKVLLSK